MSHVPCGHQCNSSCEQPRLEAIQDLIAFIRRHGDSMDGFRNRFLLRASARNEDTHIGYSWLLLRVCGPTIFRFCRSDKFVSVPGLLSGILSGILVLGRRPRFPGWGLPKIRMQCFDVLLLFGRGSARSVRPVFRPTRSGPTLGWGWRNCAAIITMKTLSHLGCGWGLFTLYH